MDLTLLPLRVFVSENCNAKLGGYWTAKKQNKREMKGDTTCLLSLYNNKVPQPE